MSSHSATVRSEVLEALRMSPEPLGRQPILALCPSAMEAQDISLALNELRKQGLAVRSEDKRWSYADGQGTIAGGRPPRRTAAPTAPKQHSTPPGNEGQSERVRPAPRRSRGGNGAAPAKTQQNDPMHDLLRSHAQHTREILELYIEAQDDPVLRHLVESAGAAAKALEEHTARKETL